MSDDERKGKLLHSLQATLRLMPYSKPDGAAFLLDLGLRGLCLMHNEGLISAANAEQLRHDLREAFQAAHPQLDILLAPELSALDAVLGELLGGLRPDTDPVPQVRAALQAFCTRSMEVIH